MNGLFDTFKNITNSVRENRFCNHLYALGRDLVLEESTNWSLGKGTEKLASIFPNIASRVESLVSMTTIFGTTQPILNSALHANVLTFANFQLSVVTDLLDRQKRGLREPSFSEYYLGRLPYMLAKTTAGLIASTCVQRMQSQFAPSKIRAGYWVGRSAEVLINQHLFHPKI